MLLLTRFQGNPIRPLELGKLVDRQEFRGDKGALRSGPDLEFVGEELGIKKMRSKMFLIFFNLEWPGLQPRFKDVIDVQFRNVVGGLKLGFQENRYNLH